MRNEFRGHNKVIVSPGVTLLEILMAMLILGLVTAGIFAAFVFSRQVGIRSQAELDAQNFAQETAEDLRTRIQSLGLTAGRIYVDQRMRTIPNNAEQVAWLDLPADWSRRFQTAEEDGRYVYIEFSGENLDGDGLSGIDFNTPADGTDLMRVRIVVRWTTPTAQ